MSNLRELKKRYHNSLATYQFSKSLLNASVSNQEIFNQKLHAAGEIRRICSLINSKNVSRPSFTILCGPDNMFSGDFKKIIHETGDLLLGKKVKGLKYDLSSIPCSLNTCEFKYMDFATNSLKSLSLENILNTNVDKYGLHTVVDGNINNILSKSMWNYILSIIQYNEQKYRVVAINKFVNNCEKRLHESKLMYYKARNSEITNQIIGMKIV